MRPTPPSNPHTISRYAYAELRAFCRQYGEKKSRAAALAGVSSPSVAAGTAAAMPAYSTSTRATRLPTRAPASARDSFSTPNGGPGAAAPGAFPPALSGGMSASPKAEWGTWRSPVDTIFENNVFCYFLPFFRMRGRPEV